MVRDENRLVFALRLTPKASKTAITEWTRDEDGNPVLKAGVTAVPENGKANKALIALLSKEWKIPKSSILILKGETDRNKILSVPKDTKTGMPER